MTTITQAIASLRPNVEWVLTGDDIENIQYINNNIVPVTRAEVDAEIIKLEKAAADKAAADAAAINASAAHAKSLGFTDAMIAVMYPGLVEAVIPSSEPEPTFADLTKRDEPPIVDP